VYWSPLRAPVKPDVAQKQTVMKVTTKFPELGAADETTGSSTGGQMTTEGGKEQGTSIGGAQTPTRPKRFYGTVVLDATRVGRDAGRIADEVIAHLSGLVGSSLKVTLEIEADVSGGVPENVIRTATENSRTLKFSSYSFEQE
jgi:hypothetical protein